jgi:iron complex outermembrane receptor protein
MVVGNKEFYIWGDNLLDEQFDYYGYYYPPFYDGGSEAQIGSPSEGRIFGVGLALYF